jgi:hypothetical protein
LTTSRRLEQEIKDIEQDGLYPVTDEEFPAARKFLELRDDPEKKIIELGYGIYFCRHVSKKSGRLRRQRVKG